MLAGQQRRILHTFKLGQQLRQQLRLSLKFTVLRMALEEVRKLWREKILQGVEQVVKMGDPGVLVVWGDYAEPILTGDTTKDVIIAAAELGNGRIVVFAHDGYSEWILGTNPVHNCYDGFRQNVLWWVTKGEYTAKWKVLKLNKENLMHACPSNTILVWTKPEPKDAEFTEELKKFVQAGGSVIIGVTPWGSMQIYKYDLEAISCYRFLADVGIFLSEDISAISGTTVNVKGNQASEARVPYK